MRTVAAIGLAVTLLSVAPVAHSAAKIGVVDVGEVFSGYCRVEESQSEFAAYQEAGSAKLEAEAGALEKLQERLRVEGEAMTEDAREALQAEINTKRQEVARGYQSFQQELQVKNRALVEARVEEIYAAIRKLAEEKGYDLVINREAVLYAPEAADITAQVIEKLNLAAAETAPAPGGATPAPAE